MLQQQLHYQRLLKLAWLADIYLDADIAGVPRRSQFFDEFHRSLCYIVFVNKNGDFLNEGRANGHMYLRLHPDAAVYLTT